MKTKADYIVRKIRELPRLTGKAVEVARGRDADLLMAMFASGIADGTFRLAYLTPKTIQRKARKGYSRPEVPLFGLGTDGKRTYATSLRKYKLKKGWVVRMPKTKHHESKLDMAALFDIHENGKTIKMPNGAIVTIPRRPAFQRAYQAFLAKQASRARTKEMSGAIVQYLRTGSLAGFRRLESAARAEGSKNATGN